jgi:toluene monooxygenase system ferredoxin subunit
MSWKTICSSSDVAPNTIKQFEVEGIKIILANYGDGFAAFPPFCPHMEEPLSTAGMLVGPIFVCSKHLWQWDLSTKEKAGAAEKDLLFYELKQDGNNVLINLEQELTYDYGSEDDNVDDDDFFN